MMMCRTRMRRSIIVQEEWSDKTTGQEQVRSGLFLPGHTGRISSKGIEHTRRIRSVIRRHGNCTFDIPIPCAYIERKTRVSIMSDTYFDLPSRMEDSFPEIDSDIVIDLRENNEDYAEIHQQISELKRRFPCIAQVMDDKAEVHLTTEEHVAFSKYLRLSRKLEDMERLQLYFRGHTDAVPITRKSKRFDTSGSEQSGSLSTDRASKQGEIRYKKL